jgi:hypothetical protein
MFLQSTIFSNIILNNDYIFEKSNIPMGNTVGLNSDIHDL